MNTLECSSHGAHLNHSVFSDSAHWYLPSLSTQPFGTLPSRSGRFPHVSVLCSFWAPASPLSKTSALIWILILFFSSCFICGYMSDKLTWPNIQHCILLKLFTIVLNLAGVHDTLFLCFIMFLLLKTILILKIIWSCYFPSLGSSRSCALPKRPYFMFFLKKANTSKRTQTKKTK